jgi:hypothetical protein
MSKSNVIAPVAVFSALALSLACGSASSTNNGSTGTKSSTATSTAAEKSVSIEGARAEFPAGSLPEQSVAAVAAVDAPSEFDIHGAVRSSGAFAVTVSGDPAEALAPFALELDLEEAAALHDQAKTRDNLCVFAKDGAGKLFAWRNGGIEIAADGKGATIETKTFGVYQAVFCGALALKDFVLVAGEEPKDGGSEHGVEGTPAAHVD